MNLEKKMIRENLIMLRRLNKYSQEEIAERIGISRQAYGKWEKGETIPDIEKCAKLAEVYGVTLDSLMGTEKMDDNMVLPPAPKGKHIFGTVTVSERGQIVIPKQARELFAIKGGDRLVLLGDEVEGLALVREEVFTKRVHAALELAAKTT